MKIYAIRDRLIDYYMQPFVGPDDKNVLASVARLINTGETTSDIAQAPHHFEVWKLGEVTEDGHLIPGRQLIQDCAALVRPGLRTGIHPRAREAPETTAESTDSTGGAGSPGRAETRPIPAQAPATGPTPHQGATPPGRGNTSADITAALNN